MKEKGSSAERELVSMLWGSNFAALRAAGSGVQRFYCPDVLASNGSRVLAFECKSTKHKQQYLEPQQVEELLKFAQLFRAEAWIAVKFSMDWRFFKVDDLESSGKNLVATKDTDKGKMLIDVTKMTTQNSELTAPGS